MRTSVSGTVEAIQSPAKGLPVAQRQSQTVPELGALSVERIAALFVAGSTDGPANGWPSTYTRIPSSCSIATANRVRTSPDRLDNRTISASRDAL